MKAPRDILKEKGIPLEELVVKYAKDLFGKTPQQLSAAERDAVALEIVAAGREGANIACGLGGGTLGGAAIGAAVTGPLAPLGAAVGAIIGGILGAIIADEAYVKGAVPLTSGPPPFPCGQLDLREVIRSLRPDPHRDL